MDIRITLPDSRSMREALETLREHCAAERDDDEQNGRSSRAEAFERRATTVWRARQGRPVCSGHTDARPG